MLLSYKMLFIKFEQFKLLCLNILLWSNYYSFNDWHQSKADHPNACMLCSESAPKPIKKNPFTLDNLKKSKISYLVPESENRPFPCHMPATWPATLFFLCYYLVQLSECTVLLSTLLFQTSVHLDLNIPPLEWEHGVCPDMDLCRRKSFRAKKL